MSDFSKHNKTAEVTFKEDFKGYKKGETHYIHKDSVERLKLKEVATVKDIDWKEKYKEAKKEVEKA